MSWTLAIPLVTKVIERLFPDPEKQTEDCNADKCEHRINEEESKYAYTCDDCGVYDINNTSYCELCKVVHCNEHDCGLYKCRHCGTLAALDKDCQCWNDE